MDFVGVLRKIEKSVIVALFLLMVSLFFLNILVREVAVTYVHYFAWIEEAVRLLNIYLIFFALGLALEKGRHVSIDSLRNKLSKKSRRVLTKLIDLTGFLVCLYMIILSYRLMNFIFGTGQVSPTLGIEMGWIYFAPVVGFSSLALRYALSFFNCFDRYASQKPAGPNS
ncbi:TRAP transporter small permease [Polycladidibacter stylochi]|uniref:TRAP transporter small permease n=1 Tax=Polycladidibacter stylochi TaxID=1807766 RepID=UPI000833B869|nr:TRAP transporter small permease [Pseudovibrio stylochi]